MIDFSKVPDRGPLEGDSIVRLVYADEAGISQNEPNAVVASVIVHADQNLVAIERHFGKLLEKYIPPEVRDGFAFHAVEIFNGGKTMKRHDPEWDRKRLEIAAEIAAIPGKFKLPIALGWVERAGFPQTFHYPNDISEKEKQIAVHVNAFMTSAMMVEHWMRRNASNEICLMIVEDNDQARQLIRDTQRFHQDPKLAKTLDEHSRVHFPFRKIKEDPLFQPKRPTSPLQIADFCAYAYKRYLNKDQKIKPFMSAIWPLVIYFEEDDFSPRKKSSS